MYVLLYLVCWGTVIWSIVQFNNLTSTAEAIIYIPTVAFIAAILFGMWRVRALRKKPLRDTVMPGTRWYGFFRGITRLFLIAQILVSGGSIYHFMGDHWDIQPAYVAPIILHAIIVAPFSVPLSILIGPFGFVLLFFETGTEAAARTDIVTMDLLLIGGAFFRLIEGMIFWWGRDVNLFRSLDETRNRLLGQAPSRKSRGKRSRADGSSAAPGMPKAAVEDPAARNARIEEESRKWVAYGEALRLRGWDQVQNELEFRRLDDFSQECISHDLTIRLRDSWDERMKLKKGVGNTRRPNAWRTYPGRPVDRYYLERDFDEWVKKNSADGDITPEARRKYEKEEQRRAYRRDQNESNGGFLWDVDND
ncbi:hypothetical protein DEO23_12250 [Brachybacterium endophyticum]|uniref:Uncharacterized protein n=1 Tax=Brachybacterium endophyticum TaxID=2182385 RepID=A0A2U2RHL3_9MICO|nr:hypothetical protein DEO23_12250 [Brachybacterium endophyticum]